MADSTPSTEPSPATVITQMLGGFQIAQALYVVTKLGVPTILEQDGPSTVHDLAERTGARTDVLHRLIRTLASLGVFTTEGGTVATTPLGDTLSEKHPQSQYDLACFWMETHYQPFAELLNTARTGKPAAEHYYGMPFFEWSNLDPERNALMARAMADVTTGLRAGLFDEYQLPEGAVIADIGGADGSVLAELLSRATDRRGIVFDQPGVAPAAEETMARAGLADRIEIVSGDFFDAVPAADIYVLSQVLHDWNDEATRRILGSIASAASPGSRLLIIESIVPSDDSLHQSKMSDLTMLAMVTGQERSVEEYRQLLESAGFVLDDVVSTPTAFSIVEATLR